MEARRHLVEKPPVLRSVSRGLRATALLAVSSSVIAARVHPVPLPMYPKRSHIKDPSTDMQAAAVGRRFASRPFSSGAQASVRRLTYADILASGRSRAALAAEAKTNKVRTRWLRKDMERFGWAGTGDESGVLGGDRLDQSATADVDPLDAATGAESVFGHRREGEHPAASASSSKNSGGVGAFRKIFNETRRKADREELKQFKAGARKRLRTGEGIPKSESFLKNPGRNPFKKGGRDATRKPDDGNDDDFSPEASFTEEELQVDGGATKSKVSQPTDREIGERARVLRQQRLIQAAIPNAGTGRWTKRSGGAKMDVRATHMPLFLEHEASRGRMLTQRIKQLNQWRDDRADKKAFKQELKWQRQEKRIERFKASLDQEEPIVERGR